jgi:protein-L-isoaspartate(D-aspartate) O-methyltransferase
MDLPVPDYAEARNLMVDGQIRPTKVTDPRILNAMRTLPRERFVPADRAPFAYIDEDLPIGDGRVLVEPLITARLVQTLRPRARQRALVVGAGTGYGAAVLAACGPHVTALEEDEALLHIARQVLPAVAPGVSVVCGPLRDGWAAGAPYDLIMIEGAVQELPAFCAEQLRTTDARLVAVIMQAGQASRAVLAEPVPGGLRAQPEFDCATPLLRPLMRAPGFVF